MFGVPTRQTRTPRHTVKEDQEEALRKDPLREDPLREDPLRKDPLREDPLRKVLKRIVNNLIYFYLISVLIL